MDPRGSEGKSKCRPRRGDAAEAADGHVVLKGHVRSYFQKQMAQEAIRRVDGVQRIENMLEVSWG